MATTKQRVKAGVALLNKVMPDWFMKIKLSQLRMTSPVKCILGQLYESFWNTSTTRMPPEICDAKITGDYGFFIPNAELKDSVYGCPPPNSKAKLFSYEDLTDEWKSAIRALREKAKTKKAKLVAKK